MERRADRKWRHRKPYETMRNQNFLRKDNCEDYHDISFRKFKNANQYQYRKCKEREMNNHLHIFNLKSSNKREVQNVSTDINVKICPWSEEAAEEERKRQVSDTANELKNKLKMWNTVKSKTLLLDQNTCSERTKVLSGDMKVLPMQTSEPKNAEVNNMNNEPIVQQCGQTHLNENNVYGNIFNISGQEASNKKSKNIGIFSKINLLRSQSLSSVSNNKQKKIQQSLIGELMAIPKDNLKNVLGNPQTHPKLEQKMAQIVKENRLILAQKFRSLAESKINQQGQFVCSRFVDDVGDLIDSDIAVDLCQLPPELITQISNIFQLDFDDSLKVSDVQENSNINKNMNDNCNPETSLKSDKSPDINDPNSEERISDMKVEPQVLGNGECDDLKDTEAQNWYNASSSENFHDTLNVKCIGKNPHLSSFLSSDVVPTEVAVSASDGCNIPGESDTTNSKCFPRSCETLNIYNNDYNIACKLPYTVNEWSDLVNGIKREPEETEETNCTKKNSSDKFAEMNVVADTWAEQCGSKPKGKMLNLKRGTAQPKCSKGKSIKYMSDNNIQITGNIFCQNEDLVYKTTETQTDINLIEADHSQPFLGQFYSEGTEKSLLREVQMIDELLHKLNQRRFIIFLKLIGLESCNLNGNNLKTSLMQTITNSDAKLMEELSLGGNQKVETKINARRKKNSNNQKNASKKKILIRNAEEINNTLGVNVQDPTCSRRKFGGKTGYRKNRDEYARLWPPLMNS